MFNRNGLNVFLDISTYCNAACPQCHRTNPNGLEKADWLPLVQWNLQTFKNAYRLHLKSKTNYAEFGFCGTWGDPVMNKDLLKMVEYIIENSKANIIFDTNGSIRDEDWWWQLGILAGKRLTVFFAVDGINQEMHSLYRRNTNLNKVLNNMKALSNTLAKVKARIIVFKHNESYLNEIKHLAINNGAIEVIATPSDRWPKGPVFNFVDENNNDQTLEKSKILYEHKV